LSVGTISLFLIYDSIDLPKFEPFWISSVKTCDMEINVYPKSFSIFLQIEVLPEHFLPVINIISGFLLKAA